MIILLRLSFILTATQDQMEMLQPRILNGKLHVLRSCPVIAGHADFVPSGSAVRRIRVSKLASTIRPITSTPVCQEVLHLADVIEGGNDKSIPPEGSRGPFNQSFKILDEDRIDPKCQLFLQFRAKQPELWTIALNE